MSNISNKIEASDESINALLKDKKFFIDYFQREYRWEEKHMMALIEDLTSTFLKSYDPNHARAEVANYQSYYLGPVVFSSAESGKNSIIDGQQRITSITLFLIYLNHLQKELENKVQISSLIFSETYGEKSFNMTDEDRKDVLKGLYEDGEYDPSSAQDETVINICERYNDIDAAFPEAIDEMALPYFIDWFIGNVVIVKITAYSDENAYTIFETMNDRGMNLTPTEMLKGYVLSRLADKSRRNEINEIWKDKIQILHEIDSTADISFFQAWLRAKYAVSMRPTKAGAENQDFELIGTRFHNWFKDEHEKLLQLKTADDFYEFFKKDFVFMVNWFVKSRDLMKNLDERCPHLCYINTWGIAPSLQDAMILATLDPRDSEQTVMNKMDAVARFIETYTVRRAVNYRKFGASSIKYTFFNIIKAIRNTSLDDLKRILLEEIESLDEKFEGIQDFSMHQQNKRFVKHLLSRITGFVDQQVGRPTRYVSYHDPAGKPFEIEHLWGNVFAEHRDEFEQEHDFSRCRNSIGAMVLLPNGTNQSFNSDQYTDKLKHYLKENTYAQTLHPDFYEKNPNFLKSAKLKNISFRSYKTLMKEDIAARARTVQELCDTIWSTDYYVSQGDMELDHSSDDGIPVNNSLDQASENNLTLGKDTSNNSGLNG